MQNDKTKKLINIILRGIGLAMGIAVFVLGILGEMTVENSIQLLSLGMVAHGLYLFQDKKGE